MIVRIAFCIFLASLLTSCATFCNYQNQSIHLSSSEPVQIKINGDSLRVDEGVTTIKVKREKKQLRIQVDNGSFKREVMFRPVNSPAFWANIIFSDGIGMFVDWKKDKRWGYRKNIYFDIHDTVVRIQSFAPIRKGTLQFNFFLPWVNGFRISEGSRNTWGFMGVEAGADYYFRNKLSLSVNVGGSADVPVPVPAAIDYFGVREFVSAGYLNMRATYTTGRLNFGAGFSLTKYSWSISNHDDSTFATQSSVNIFGGLSFSALIRCGSHFHTGILYQPSVLNFSKGNRFSYQHLASITFGCKLSVLDGRRKKSKT
jgi:hypothetical protein